MEFELGRGKRARRAYGFDEVALVPGRVTVTPAEIDVAFAVNGPSLEIPFLAAAMDGLGDTRFAAEMGHLGGLAVLNLDGVQTRYEDPAEVLAAIAESPVDQINTLLQKIYTAPVQDGLIGQRIEEITSAGVACAGSTGPAAAGRGAPVVQEGGARTMAAEG